MLLRTSLACELSRAHIQSIGDGNLQGSPIESYLGTYCTFVFCNEMEEKIEEILKVKLNSIKAGRITNFIVNTNKGMLQRTQKSDIAKFVDNFGPDAKTEFNSAFEDREITFYTNIITKRHLNAHDTGSGVTLSEVERAIPVANKILERISAVIDGP